MRVACVLEKPIPPMPQAFGDNGQQRPAAFDIADFTLVNK